MFPAESPYENRIRADLLREMRGNPGKIFRVRRRFAPGVDTDHPEFDAAYNPISGNIDGKIDGYCYSFDAYTGRSSAELSQIVEKAKPRRFAAMDSSDGEFCSDYPSTLKHARESQSTTFDKVVEVVTYEVNSDGSRGAELPAIAA